MRQSFIHLLPSLFPFNTKFNAMKITLRLLNIFLIASILTACSTDNQPAGFDYGSVNENVYSNDFFNCQIDLPEGWVVQSKEETERLTNLGKDLVAGDDERLKAVIDASQINSANLLSVFQFELGSPVEYNPNISVVAENVMHAPGIKSGADYLYQTRKLLMQSQFQYDYISEEYESETFNGKEFHRMDGLLSYAGLEIKQHYYSTITNGFAFNVIISYINDEQKSDLMAVINSITFKE